MADNINAIEIEGITRNATKIGVQDGQAEDLINLRFQDGSWRASGDGKKVFYMGYHGTGPVPSTPYVGTTYEQLYIHTNVYRHLLGVREVDGVSKLFWFANINEGGVFEPLAEEVELASFSGSPSVRYCPNGNLITITFVDDGTEKRVPIYLLYYPGSMTYKSMKIDYNGDIDGDVFPFSEIDFRPMVQTENATSVEKRPVLYIIDGLVSIEKEGNYLVVKSNLTTTADKVTVLQNTMLKQGSFVGSFLICAAFKTYSGKYILASRPKLIRCEDVYYDSRDAYPVWDRITVGEQISGTSVYKCTSSKYVDGDYPTINRFPSISSSVYVYGTNAVDATIPYSIGPSERIIGRGTKLQMKLPYIDKSFAETNDDIIKSLCVFITPPVSDYDLEKTYSGAETLSGALRESERGTTGNPYPNTYTYHSVNHLTKMMRTDEWRDMIANGLFYKISEQKFDEALLSHNGEWIDIELNANIGKDMSPAMVVQSDLLDFEATDRDSYFPKVYCTYNGRLHFANYYKENFHGYSLNDFIEAEGDYNSNTLTPAEQARSRITINNENISYPVTIDNVEYNTEDELWNAAFAGAFSLKPSHVPNWNPMGLTNVFNWWIEVTIENSDADIICIRGRKFETGTCHRYGDNLVSDEAPYYYLLNPFISYPDARAKEISFYFLHIDLNVRDHYANNNITFGGSIRVSKATYELTPHPYANIAYYMGSYPFSPAGSTFEEITSLTYLDRTIESVRSVMQETRNKESFLNGLKVSKTDNQLYFPVEHTYQIGSGEILAICSNAIAVGTGQTGAAPLYVFCTDGLYALFVDETGEMAYTNSRIIARDVLNNPDSVTPIDTGVAFTTDRGLMLIAGEQVEEIGAPAEGDVEQYANASSSDYNEFIKDRLTNVAELPLTLCDATDFLTYLKDKGTSGKAAIINYNHNQRELIVSNPNYPYSYVMDREGNWSRRDYSADEYVNNYPTSYRVKTGVFYKVDEEGDANTPLEQRKEADNQIFYLSNEIKLGSIGFKQAYRFVVRGYFETLPGKAVGCYLQGSYDGRKWATIGGNEKKSGKFTNIGCHVSHADMRFYRICLAGQVTGKTRIDYMEMSSSPSVLNTKIR